MIAAAQMIRVEQVDDALFRARSQQIAILPSEEHRAGRSKIEILAPDVLPVERQKVIEQRQILQRDRNLGIGIIARDRIEDSIGSAAISAAVSANNRSAAAPDSRGIGIRKQHLVNHRMMPVAYIDGIESRNALTAALP